MADIEENKLVDFRELLAGPLLATIHADFTTAKQFMEFITEYGFEKNQTAETEASDALSKLRMITFVYSRYNPQTAQEEEFRLQVPALSLIPLPMLQIDYAEFEFNIRVYAEMEYQRSVEAEKGALKRGFNNVEKERELKEQQQQQQSPQGFKARLSPAMGQKDGEMAPTVDANMKVKVVMRQADLPAGIANLITVFNDSTSIIPHRRELEKSPQEPVPLPANVESKTASATD